MHQNFTVRTLTDAVEQIQAAVRDDHITGEVPNDAAADPGGLVAVVWVQKGGGEIQLLLSRKN